MLQEFSRQLCDETLHALARDSRTRFAIVGHSATAYELTALFKSVGAEGRLLGIFDEKMDGGAGDIHPLDELAAAHPEVVIVAANAEKELLLRKAQPHLKPSTQVVVAGYEHYTFKNSIYENVVQNSLVASLANGYPNSLIHIFQCLANAARLGVAGVVAEFGIFKGGTTMMLSRFIEELGQDWKVIGFDTFAGFPPKRSLFDMYEHDDCVFSDEIAVRRYLEHRNVEVIRGDLVETAQRLESEDIVLGFFDTDNYTSTTAILDVVQERVVVGGALVFDHFTGKNRFKYTLGERMAAMRLLDDPRYFHLHDTGVFLRQQ